MDIEQLGYRIMGCAIEAHRTLGGCGLLESIYEDALAYELVTPGIPFTRQELIRIVYKDTVLGSPLRD